MEILINLVFTIKKKKRINEKGEIPNERNIKCPIFLDEIWGNSKIIREIYVSHVWPPSCSSTNVLTTHLTPIYSIEMTSPAQAFNSLQQNCLRFIQTTIAGPLGLGVNGVEVPRTSEPLTFNATIIQPKEGRSQGPKALERYATVETVETVDRIATLET